VNISRIARIFLIVVCLVPVTALAQSEGCPAGPVAEDAPVITIGTTASLTGRYAREGTEMLNGYNLWLDWVNNEAGGINVEGVCHRADLFYFDDRSGEIQVEMFTEQLIDEDQVDFLLGPYSSNLTMVASDIADAKGVLMVQGNAADEVLFSRGYEMFFGVLTPASMYSRSAIEQAYEVGARTAVIGYESAPFSTAVAMGAQAVMEELGIEVLAVESYPAGTSNLTRLLTAFAELDPDLFVGGGHYEDAVLIARTAKEVGFSPAAMLITVGPSIPSFLTELGDDANYIWGASQWERSLGFEGERFGSAADFSDRYFARYNVIPSYQAASATAAALALQLGIEAAGSTDPDRVASALRRLEVETFYGTIAFDETGKNDARPMVAVQIQDGELVVIAPPEVAVAEPVYPAPAWDER
jgi:branched-chain amino acid transport system substrate-binding protein